MTKQEFITENFHLEQDLARLNREIQDLKAKLAVSEAENGLLRASLREKEEAIKFEQRRLGQTIDAVDSASQAAGAVGRLVHRLCDELEPKLTALIEKKMPR